MQLALEMAIRQIFYLNNACGDNQLWQSCLMTRQAVSCPCRSVCPSLKQEGGSCADAMCTIASVSRGRGVPVRYY
ncbi:hypothetical protein B0T13DRAFT_460312 [Neurospora crassa]|nr:hypothetical protein B0T13DRAFT_460312 [Neurospora crassa]